MSNLSTELQADNARRLQRNPGTEVWLVLTGDWGGQVYLTVPFNLVGDTTQISSILAELDTQAWSCNENEGASAYLKDTLSEMNRWNIDLRDGVAGGMGGGAITEDLWLHDEFVGPTTDRMRNLLNL